MNKMKTLKAKNIIKYSRPCLNFERYHLYNPKPVLCRRKGVGYEVVDIELIALMLIRGRFCLNK